MGTTQQKAHTWKKESHLKNWVTLGKMSRALKKGSPWKNWSQLKKCVTCKNGSQVEKWVTLGKRLTIGEKITLDVNICKDHSDKIEVPDPLAVEDLISCKLNKKRKLLWMIIQYRNIFFHYFGRHGLPFFPILNL